MGLLDKIFGRIKKGEQGTQKVQQIDSNHLWFTMPTISNEFPQTVAPAKQTEFDIQIYEDEYRQNEFLNWTSIPLIEEEFTSIKDIWENYSKKSDDYTLFKNCHGRKTIGAPDLQVSFTDLKLLLKCKSVGQVIINGEALLNGFAIKTDNTTYFGTLSNDIATQLCICQWNENSINEILQINKIFNLVFVNWYNCDLIKND